MLVPEVADTGRKYDLTESQVDVNLMSLDGVPPMTIPYQAWKDGEWKPDVEQMKAADGRYADQTAPKVSDTWRADELYVKVKGDLKYLYAMMDDETRYWITQEVADTKYVHDARALFAKSKEVAGELP
jgi:hypothetical protein